MTLLDSIAAPADVCNRVILMRPFEGEMLWKTTYYLITLDEEEESIFCPMTM